MAILLSHLSAHYTWSVISSGGVEIIVSVWGRLKGGGGGGDTEGSDHSENNGTVLTSTESERCSKMVAVITINVNYIDLKSTVFLFLKLYTTHRTNKYLLY